MQDAQPKGVIDFIPPDTTPWFWVVILAMGMVFMYKILKLMMEMDY